MGLTGYYRRFVKGYAGIAAPLIDLLCKDFFLWSAQAQSAFDALKLAMSTALVLRLPDFSLEFVVETGASNVSIGAVLMQFEHPLSFFSKKLGPRLQAAYTYTKELYAITESVCNGGNIFWDDSLSFVQIIRAFGSCLCRQYKHRSNNVM